MIFIFYYPRINANFNTDKRGYKTIIATNNLCYQRSSVLYLRASVVLGYKLAPAFGGGRQTGAVKKIPTSSSQYNYKLKISHLQKPTLISTYGK
jgi:hypothetical protein